MPPYQAPRRCWSSGACMAAVCAPLHPTTAAHHSPCMWCSPFTAGYCNSQQKYWHRLCVESTIHAASWCFPANSQHGGGDLLRHCPDMLSSRTAACKANEGHAHPHRLLSIPPSQQRYHSRWDIGWTSRHRGLLGAHHAQHLPIPWILLHVRYRMHDRHSTTRVSSNAPMERRWGPTTAAGQDGSLGLRPPHTIVSSPTRRTHTRT
jgi:hypothetical protein